MRVGAAVGVGVAAALLAALVCAVRVPCALLLALRQGSSERV